MAYKDYKADVVSTDVYQLAKALGFVLSRTPKNENDVALVLEDITKYIQKHETTEKESEALSDSQKKLLDDILNPQEEKQEEPALRTKTLNVGAAPSEEPAVDNTWIEEERKLWEAFAAEVNLFYDEEDKDNASKTSLKFALSQDGVSQGGLVYTSRNRCQVDTDSKFVIYQGLVDNALKKDLSLTFDSSLNEKQQLMLLAAVLKNEKCYENGDKLEVINAPKIDENTLESDVFKALDKDVREILKEQIKRQKKAQKAENKEQAQHEKNLEKIEELKEKISKEKDGNKRYKLRQKQADIQYQNLTDERKAQRDKELLERDRIAAARAGITEPYQTTNKHGRDWTVQKTENARYSKEYLEVLKRKFAKEND
ncbi:MAG: hypothetical protein J5895_04960 [Alphaproteobacteria bacterium]|nr:hypothetical protein [Alphaproteobacteria bacterium]